jgi:hypothetical protein
MDDDDNKESVDEAKISATLKNRFPDYDSLLEHATDLHIKFDRNVEFDGIGLRIWDQTASCIAQEFEHTGDPVYAVSSFICSRRTGEPIEEPVLRFFEMKLNEWIRFGGVRRLDEIMGLSPGQGAISALRKTWRRERDDRLFKTVALLLKLGWELQKAAEAACAQLQREIEANPALTRKLKPSNAGNARDPEIALLKSTLVRYWGERSSDRNAALNRAETILTFGWNNEQQSRFQEAMKKLISGR